MKTKYCFLFHFIIISFGFQIKSYAQYWNRVSSGLSGTGNKLIVYNNKLIVGGKFTYAGGLPVNNIAAWDGSNWESLYDGLNGAVHDMVVWNNKLVVTGSFTEASGLPCPNIAAWNGSDWESLGKGIRSGTSLDIFSGGRSLAVYNNNLIVTGSFDSAGTIKANNIALWNGSSWSNPFGRVKGFGSKLYIDGNNMYLGGYFDTVAYVKAKNIALWNGSQWNKMSNGIGLTYSFIYANYDEYTIKGGVTFIDKYDNEIIAGGYGVPIITYTGSAWQSLSYGSFVSTTGFTNAEVVNSQIIAGGMIQEKAPDNLNIFGITKLNVNLWDHLTPPLTTGNYLGSGITYASYINDFEEFNGDFYITGSFHSEWGYPSILFAGIARLNGTVGLNKSTKDEQKNSLEQFSLTEEFKYEVISLDGKKLIHGNGNIEVIKNNLNTLSKGMYLVKLTTRTNKLSIINVINYEK